jgi:hypothetical protein
MCGGIMAQIRGLMLEVRCRKNANRIKGAKLGVADELLSASPVLFEQASCAGRLGEGRICILIGNEERSFSRDAPSGWKSSPGFLVNNKTPSPYVFHKCSF